MHQPNGYESFIGTTEAARLLRVAPRTVDRWVAAGKLEVAFRTVSGYARYDLRDVIELAEELSAA